MKKNLTLGLFSPSWWLEDEILKAQAAALAAAGFGVKIHPQNSARWGQFAGEPAERAGAFHELLSDNEVDVIMAARGGYGCLQWLEYVDFSRVEEAGKPVVGYSDVTPLLNSIANKTSVVCMHGPMLTTFSDFAITASGNMADLKTALQGQKEIILPGDVVTQGQAKGVLLGGNSTLFDQIIGTPFFPQKAQDVVFLIEDIDIKINDLDKYLLHLHHVGFLERVRGVVVGEIVDLGDNDRPFGLTLSQTLTRLLGTEIPLVTNTPCGHGERQVTLPIGASVMLNVSEGQTVISRC